MKRPQRPLRAALAWVLVAAGTASIAYPALTVAGGSLRRIRLESEVRTLVGTSRPHAAVRPEVPPHRPVRAPRTGQALGMIRIPAIGLETVFLEGVAEGVLRVGPGHLPWTALPGRGVSVIAAHRDMHFRDLEDLRPGHRIRVLTAAGSATYRVIGARVAYPEDRWVVRPESRPLLRLVTCWPSNWVGPAPQRLVVTAAPMAGLAGAAPAPTPSVPAIQHIAVADTSGDGFDDSSLPPVGTAGATMAGLAAFAAFRTGRRTRWWFLGWTLGLGVAGLTLLAGWAGPGIVAI